MAMDSSRVMERARQARVGAGALVRRNGPELLASAAGGDPFAAALAADVSKEGPSRNQSSASSG
jgi:hypothetical protein